MEATVLQPFTAVMPSGALDIEAGIVLAGEFDGDTFTAPFTMGDHREYATENIASGRIRRRDRDAERAAEALIIPQETVRSTRT